MNHIPQSRARAMIRLVIAVKLLFIVVVAPSIAAAAGDDAAAAVVTRFHDSLLSVMKEADALGVVGRYQRLEPGVVLQAGRERPTAHPGTSRDLVGFLHLVLVAVLPVVGARLGLWI